MIARLFLVSALALLLLHAGCRKAAVEAYRVPKEKDPEMSVATTANSANNGGTKEAPPSTGAMATTPVPTAEGAELSWTAPAAWKQKPPAPMRKGSYAVPGGGAEDGDLSITAFPGDVGGELANVNRWRGQVQLAPIAEADLQKEVNYVEHGGLRFGIVDIASTGANARRILGAYVAFGGATWFFKLAGPDTVVANAKPAFLAFLETVKPAPTTP